MCLTCLRASVYQPWHEAIFFMHYTHLGHVYYVLHLYPGGWGWQWFVRWSSGRGMCEQVYCQFMNPLFKALWFRQIPEYPSVAHKHLKKGWNRKLGCLVEFQSRTQSLQAFLSALVACRETGIMEFSLNIFWIFWLVVILQATNKKIQRILHYPRVSPGETLGSRLVGFRFRYLCLVSLVPSLKRLSCPRRGLRTSIHTSLFFCV